MTKRSMVTALLVLVIGTIAWLRFGPLPDKFLDTSHNDSVVVLDRNGAVLYDALSASGTRGRRLSAGSIPQNVIAATLAAEDRRFFHHFGIDPLAIARAAVHNAREGRIVEGGSTLTQQTVKLLLARNGKPEPRTLRSKAREAMLAMRLEQRLTKEEILSLYLSIAPYGNQFVGIERASDGYFGTTADQLTHAQAAFLAALPQKPSILNPYRNMRGATKRGQQILVAMREARSIDEQQFRVARSERINVTRRHNSLLAPHFVQHVLAAGPIVSGTIRTTLDSELQRDVRGVIEAHRTKLEKHGAHNVAVVVLKNDTGEWLAWEGSGDYFDQEHGGAIDGVTTPRQPGSALKPFTYAAAFERGFSPASALPDVPANFPTAEEGIVYAPRNYDGVFRGPLSARSALAGSVNVPAVWLLSRVGTASFLRLLRSSGVTTFDKSADYYGLGATLGDAEVRLDELVAAYSVFARRGRYLEPAGVSPRSDAKERRVVSEQTAFWIADILSDTEAREFAFGRGNSLELPFPAAVKTGTSQAYHDNWTIGFTRDVTVGVWVGNFDRTPLRNSSGVTGAAPLFNAVIQAAQRRYGGDTDAVVDKPDNLQQQTVCLVSGMRATPACRRTGSEWIPAAIRSCNWHILSHRQSRGGTEVVTRTAWPMEYRAWAASQDDDVASAPAVPRSLASDSPIQIVSPPPEAIYLLDPTLRTDFQTVKLKATVRGDDEVEWRIDGRRIGASRRELRWSARPGKHVAEARSGGRVARVEFTVK